MHFGNPASDRKAQSGAARFPRPRSIRAVTALKNQTQFALWNADPGVSYHDLRVARSGRQLNLA